MEHAKKKSRVPYCFGIRLWQRDYEWGLHRIAIRIHDRHGAERSRSHAHGFAVDLYHQEMVLSRPCRNVVLAHLALDVSLPELATRAGCEQLHAEAAGIIFCHLKIVFVTVEHHANMRGLK